MEFAVVAPVFFLFVFGMIEFGRMVMVEQIITNASREGARMAVLDPSTTSSTSWHDQIVSAVTTYLTNAGIPNVTSNCVTVNPNDPSASSVKPGDPVTVTVTIPFNQVSWLPTPLFLGGKNLTASTVMRRETVQ